VCCSLDPIFHGIRANELVVFTAAAATPTRKTLIERRNRPWADRVSMDQGARSTESICEQEFAKQAAHGFPPVPAWSGEVFVFRRVGGCV
jgi:hypothetical protein